jgi:hypothetical protein
VLACFRTRIGLVSLLLMLCRVQIFLSLIMLCHPPAQEPMVCRQIVIPNILEFGLLPTFTQSKVHNTALVVLLPCSVTPSSMSQLPFPIYRVLSMTALVWSPSSAKMSWLGSLGSPPPMPISVNCSSGGSGWTKFGDFIVTDGNGGRGGIFAVIAMMAS